MPTIDRDRLLADLRQLASFGRYETGVHRPSLSPQDMAARGWLADRMAEAGLDPAIDGVGTLIGRSRNAGPALLIGSHTDTQPQGGWLDGALGVVYGIEVARAFRDAPETRELAVDVASWIDEEGSYLGMLGSQSFCTGVAPEAIAAARSRDGEPLADAIAAAGLAGRPVARIEPGRYAGYLEAHVEQGGLLEADGKRIGVVTGIVGIRSFTIGFTGQQNHAGTTPMPLRRDAGAALIAFAHDVGQRFAALAGPRTVWTSGRMVLHPNAPSVIPGKAELSLQFRDLDPARLDAFEAAMAEAIAEAEARGPCRVAIVDARRVTPTPMAEQFQAAIERAAERHAAGLSMRMPSAAGHDAQILGRHMPAGMLFVPSIGGISHHIAENTADDDIALGAQVLATAAATILGR